MFQLNSIPDRICGFNAWNRRTQNTFKAFYALNSTNSRKQYVHSILLHFSFYFIPYRECKDSDLTRYFQRFYAIIFSQLSYILKYILLGQIVIRVLMACSVDLGHMMPPWKYNLPINNMLHIQCDKVRQLSDNHTIKCDNSYFAFAW